MRPVAVALAGLWTLTVSACPGDRPPPAQPGGTSDEPVAAARTGEAPTAPARPRVTLPVPAHAFVLVAPDDGTELLDAAAARELHRDAAAGLRNGSTCFGVVLPFQVAQGASLKAVAAQRLAALGTESPALEDLTIAWSDLVRYCDEPAMRAAVNGRRAGRAVRLQQTVVLAEVSGQTRAWEVRVESSAPVFGVARRCHDRHTAAFELDVLDVAPGKLKPASP